MTFTTILVIIGTIATIIICKTINGNFEIKNNALAQKEKDLVEAQQSLRDKRKELSKRLEDLKTFLKAGIKTEAKAAQPKDKPQDLRGWLVNKQILTDAQYLTAEIYATEKNIEVVAALLTLNMISVDVYEQAKKLNLF